MKKLRVLGCFIAVFLLMALTTGCAKKAEETIAEKLTPVEAYKVTKGSIEVLHSVSGRVKPIEEVSIVPKIPGKVEKIAKEIGDTVKKGELLFCVEKKDLYDQLAQLDAQMKQTDAGIEMANINIKRSQGVDEEQQTVRAEAMLKHAELEYNQAKTDYENNKALYEAGAISKQMFDASEDRYELASIQYKNSKDSYELAVESAKVQLTQAEAGKDAIEVQKEILTQKLLDCDITSPIDGIVVQRNITLGEMASQQLPSYTVVKMDTVIVEANVTETLINRLQKGQELIVTIKALYDKQFKGVIDAISPAAVGQSVGYQVKIKIDNSNNEIKPGMFAQVDFILENKKDIIVTPQEIILSEKGKSYVYVVENDIAKKTEVRTGVKNDSNIEILSGLKEGEQVIIKGQKFVSDGEKVQLVGGAK